MLLNESLFLLLQVACHVIRPHFFLGFDTSLHFQRLNRFLCFVLLDHHLSRDFTLEARLAQIGELAHRLVKHGQQLVRIQVQVKLQLIN